MHRQLCSMEHLLDILPSEWLSGGGGWGVGERKNRLFLKVVDKTLTPSPWTTLKWTMPPKFKD